MTPDALGAIVTAARQAAYDVGKPESDDEYAVLDDIVDAILALLSQVQVMRKC